MIYSTIHVFVVVYIQNAKSLCQNYQNGCVHSNSEWWVGS
jgi:hypothetical protein